MRPGGVPMRCPSCQADLANEAKYCPECGHNLKLTAPLQPHAAARPDTPAGDEGALKLPTGFSRTLSTELVTKQMELRAQVKLGTLVQNRTYQPGEALMRKGETSRDLFFLTEGLVAISRQEEDKDFILNEIAPPYILGEIAFLFGTPRTATVTAKTAAKAFVVKYEDLRELTKDFPAWLPALLTALASDIKSLHHKANVAAKRVAELEAQRRS
jgi:CRP/FNR family transcriptional regulator, cyclic AMP receptor protein